MRIAVITKVRIVDNTPLQTDAIFKVGVCNLKPLLATKMKGRFISGIYGCAISDLYVGGHFGTIKGEIHIVWHPEETFLHNLLEYLLYPIEQTRKCRAVVQLIVIQ